MPKMVLTLNLLKNRRLFLGSFKRGFKLNPLFFMQKINVQNLYIQWVLNLYFYK